jgi:hypothetical protein
VSHLELEVEILKKRVGGGISLFELTSSRTEEVEIKNSFINKNSPWTLKPDVRLKKIVLNSNYDFNYPEFDHLKEWK